MSGYRDLIGRLVDGKLVSPFLIGLYIFFSLVDSFLSLAGCNTIHFFSDSNCFCFALSSRLARTASRNDYIILFHIS